MRKLYLYLLAVALTFVVNALVGCPADVDVDRKVQGAVKVPGLEEAVLAKDKALKGAILLSWSADPELAQEQLAVEDVRAGNVRITGIVSRPELKERAENIVKDQDGVHDVVSTITVDESLKDKRIDVGEM
jgi:osmotically-inducible protein OsmY